MVIIAYVIALGLLFWLMAYLPVMGVVYILIGEWIQGLFCWLPLMCFIGVVLYRHYIVQPKETLMVELSHMYKYPRRLTKNERADKWHSGFSAVIQNGIAAVDDPAKQADLKQCHKIVEKMAKDNVFHSLHRAFRITGCHLKVTDDNGRVLTQIV